MARIELYLVEGAKVVRKGKFCPRCGTGVFLAEHVDRFHCGRCGYTEFKAGVPKFRAKPSPKPVVVKKEEPKKVEEAPAAPAAPTKGVPAKGAPAKGAAPTAPAKGAAQAKGAAPAKGEPKKEEKGKKK